MPTSDRLREHPEDRIHSTVQLVDLPQTAVALRQESHPAVSGHRQIAVFRQGPVSLLSFVFEPNGLLKEHKTDGVVIILVLAGHLQVLAEGQQHDLTAGRLLALAPGVPHTVLALTGSEMLLTVHRSSGLPNSAE